MKILTQRVKSPLLSRQDIQDSIRNLFFGYVPRPRNGKVARLPQAIREQINRLLDDGLPYRDIIMQLQQSAAAPLPWPISEMNLSNWFRGGYQDWRQARRRAQVLAGRASETVSEPPGIIKTASQSVSVPASERELESTPTQDRAAAEQTSGPAPG